MFGRFAWLTTVMVAALAPAISHAQVYDPRMPAPYAVTDPYAMQGYGGNAGAGGGWTRYTELPDDRGFAYDDSYLERLLKETFRHAYFRLEYLNWNVEDPGDVVLGAPIRATINAVNEPFVNPREQFTVFDPTTGTEVGVGVSPVLDGVRGKNNNGIRGTWGFQFEPFTWESSVFALQTARTTIKAGSLPVTPTIDDNGIPGLPFNGIFVAQGVLVNGVAAQDSYLLYDQSYQASIRTNVWGAESKIILRSIDAGGPITIQPLYGVKFLNFEERLHQTGRFRVPLVTNPAITINRDINAATQNYLYGPEIGARFELPSRYLTLGFEPKMMFGVNTYRATLTTANLTSSVNEVPLSIRENKTTFGPVADLQAYARGRVSDHLSLFVAYNLMWAGFITRPADNIVYNVTGNVIPRPSAFQQRVEFSDLILQGVSVGGEVSW